MTNDEKEKEAKALLEQIEKATKEMLADEKIRQRVVDTSMNICAQEKTNEQVMECAVELYRDVIAKYLTEKKIPVYLAVTVLEIITLSICKDIDRQEKEARAKRLSEGSVSVVDMACPSTIN